MIFSLDGSQGEFRRHECKDKEESRYKDKNGIYIITLNLSLFEFLTENQIVKRVFTWDGRAS